MTDEKKTTPDGTGKGDVLGPTYEPGKPEGPDGWRKKLRSRDEMIAYLRTAGRYWYSDDWYGSERRKTKA
jgi:hypothetical protein